MEISNSFDKYHVNILNINVLQGILNHVRPVFTLHIITFTYISYAYNISSRLQTSLNQIQLPTQLPQLFVHVSHSNSVSELFVILMQQTTRSYVWEKTVYEDGILGQHKNKGKDNHKGEH